MDFSFTLESLGKNSENYFSNFKNFVLNNTQKKFLCDKFLESQFLVDCSKSYIEYMVNRSDIEISSKRASLSVLKTFFNRIIVKENLNISKKFLKISTNLIKDALCKNLTAKNTEKKFTEQKNFAEQKNFGEKILTVNHNTKKNFYVHFKNFVEKETNCEEIDNKFFGSQSVFDCTNQYIKYTLNDQKIEKNMKNIYLCSLKNFFCKIIENKEIDVNKKFLKLSVQLLDDDEISELRIDQENDTKKNVKKRKNDTEKYENSLDLQNSVAKKPKNIVQEKFSVKNTPNDITQDEISLFDRESCDIDERMIDLELESIENELQLLELLKQRNQIELELLSK